MALFGIQRYVAEEEQEHIDKDEILQELQNKIAAKRKKSKKNEDEDLVEISDNLQDVPIIEPQEKKKKQKQKKTEVNPTDLPIKEQQLDDVVLQNKFKVIGEETKQQKLKIDMVLPAWLAHPHIIDGSSNNLKEAAIDIDDLPYLNESIRQVLKNKLELKQLFPVQQAVIPWVLQAHQRPLPFRPRDICVSAPTGSGKTLAFAIPVVQLLSARVEKKVRALIVLPVGELALQIFKVFHKLTAHTDLSVQLLSKQNSFHKEQQQLVELQHGEYISKVDIIVTTPGRLIDHLHATKGFTLQALQFLIIDEADRIIDAAFQNWLQHYDMHMGTMNQTNALNFNNLLLRATQPHKLLFSATLTQDPEKLQRLRLFHPILFSAIATDLQALRRNMLSAQSNAQEALETKTNNDNGARFATPKELTEKYCITESASKPLTLYALVQEHKWRKFLCFTNSAESSERLAFVLNHLANGSLKFEQLSAQIPAKERANILNSFARGKIDGLVCSDALARGIDVPHVDVIVSYDLPRHIKTYIHRIGRTARAGRPGTAITLVTENQLQLFKKLLGNINKQVSKEQKLERSSKENEFAALYSIALKDLHAKLLEDQKQKAVMERMIRNSNILQKKSNEPKTLVEKLQAQLETHNPLGIF